MRIRTRGPCELRPRRTATTPQARCVFRKMIIGSYLFGTMWRSSLTRRCPCYLNNDQHARELSLDSRNRNRLRCSHIVAGALNRHGNGDNCSRVANQQQMQGILQTACMLDCERKERKRKRAYGRMFLNIDNGLSCFNRSPAVDHAVRPGTGLHGELGVRNGDQPNAGMRERPHMWPPIVHTAVSGGLVRYSSE